MSGRPGKGGGWNRLSDEEHALRGTKPRSGRPSPAALVAAPNPDEPPPDLCDGLSEAGRGRGFVEEAWATHTGWTVARSLLLREAGLLIDALEAKRGQPEEAGLRRALLATLAAIDFQRAVPPKPPGYFVPYPGQCR